MTARFKHKTLAKTLTYISYHAPWEFGLFWDPDGTMPWKELYWALKEDASLRFVRESDIRELSQLGLELPFVLDGNRLRLMPNFALPSYPVAERPPERLFFACRRKQYSFLIEEGITASYRPFVALCIDRDLALRLGKRRDTDPILVEVMAAKANAEGETFRSGGAGLYLVRSVPLRYLVLPLIRTEHHAALTSRKKTETKQSPKDFPVSPGSFFLNPHQVHDQASVTTLDDKGRKKIGRKKTDWKRDAKKERHKRSL